MSGALGHAAMETTEYRGIRTEIIDGHTVEMDLPPGILPSEPTPPGEHPSHPFYRPLLPSALEELPAGSYTVQKPTSPNVRDFDRYINVTEDPEGKRINYIADGLHMNLGRNNNLMTKLGYTFERGLNGIEVGSVPLPSLLQRRAAELGVDVQFFPDQKVIDSPSYLDAFAKGAYPVSTASAEYYTHDTQDDHLTAMVLGGEPLKTALQEAAIEALSSDTNLDNIAGGFDQFTAYLRGTVSPTYNMMQLPYGRNTMHVAGERIGLTPEKVDEILATAQNNALAFGMEVNDLQ